MEFAKFKLYHCPGSRSARVKWLLCELLDDRFEEELVLVYDSEQFHPEYLRKNPNHCVPMLQITTRPDETMYMMESGAMMAYLADVVPEKGLAPPADDLSFKRADYMQMLHFGSASMDMILGQIRAHEHLLPHCERDLRSSKRYRRKFTREVEPQLRNRLNAAPYISGEDFSAADCIIGHNVIWARAYGLCQDEAFRSYVKRISSRSGFQRAFADASGFTVEVPAGKEAYMQAFTG